MIDYFSKWVEVKEQRGSPTSADIIDHCKSIFSRFGIPETLFSDNEPIYKSKGFEDFCREYGINKDFSSARYPQSNGQVERTVQNVKKMLRKCHQDGSDFKIALLQYHNTPLDSNIDSPACLLMGRSLRTRLPCIKSKLINDNDRFYRNLLVNRQDTSHKYYDKNVRAGKTDIKFKPGDAVVFRDSLADKLWKQARVLSKANNPRSYHIENSQGRILNRNSKMLLPDKTGRNLLKQIEDSPESSQPAHWNPNPAQLNPLSEKQPTHSEREQPQFSIPKTIAESVPRRSKRLALLNPRRSERLTEKSKGT